jgi:hypothetical protein
VATAAVVTLSVLIGVEADVSSISTAAITKEIDATMTIVFVVILKVLPLFGNRTGDHRPDWTGRTTG